MTVQKPLFQDNLSTWVTSFWLHWPSLCQEVLKPVLFLKNGPLLVSLTNGLLPLGLKKLLKDKEELLWPISKDSKSWFWENKKDSLSKKLWLKLNWTNISYRKLHTMLFFFSEYIIIYVTDAMLVSSFRRSFNRTKKI